MAVTKVRTLDSYHQLLLAKNDRSDPTPSVEHEENIQLEALRALQYEGTRAEVALGFKERGNESVAEKRWKDAKEFYTKGILALKAPSQDDEADAAEKEKEKKVEEACYINRAFCNLELRRFPTLFCNLPESRK